MTRMIVIDAEELAALIAETLRCAPVSGAAVLQAAESVVASLPVSEPVGWARESTLMERVFRAPSALRDGGSERWFPVFAQSERKGAREIESGGRPVN